MLTKRWSGFRELESQTERGRSEAWGLALRYLIVLCRCAEVLKLSCLFPALRLLYYGRSLRHKTVYRPLSEGIAPSERISDRPLKAQVSVLDFRPETERERETSTIGLLPEFRLEMVIFGLGEILFSSSRKIGPYMAVLYIS